MCVSMDGVVVWTIVGFVSFVDFEFGLVSSNGHLKLKLAVVACGE